MEASFADELLVASENKSLSPAELRALLRRAAIRIQRTEIELDAEYVALVNEMRDEDGLPPLDVNGLLRAWLIDNGVLLVDGLDEDTETRGSA